jgi:hypothetical protein
MEDQIKACDWETGRVWKNRTTKLCEEARKLLDLDVWWHQI